VVDSSSNLYAVVPQFGGPAPGGGILKSSDGGTTWNALPPLPAGIAFGLMFVHPSDSATLYVLGSMFTPAPPGAPPGPPAAPKSVIVKSTDGGQHWSVYDIGLPQATVLN